MNSAHNALKAKLANNKKIGENRTRQITRKVHEASPSYKTKLYKRIAHENRKESNDYERSAHGQSHSLSKSRVKEIRRDTNDRYSERN